MSYTIIGNTLIFSDNPEKMTDSDIDAAFDHFVQVVSKNEEKDRERLSLVRENAQVFDLTEIWKKKDKVSFGACLVKVIPSNNRGFKVPSR